MQSADRLAQDVAVAGPHAGPEVCAVAATAELLGAPVLLQIGDRLGRRAHFLNYEAGAIVLACALIASFPFFSMPVGFAAVLIVAALVIRRAAIAK